MMPPPDSLDAYCALACSFFPCVLRGSGSSYGKLNACARETPWRRRRPGCAGGQQTDTLGERTQCAKWKKHTRTLCVLLPLLPCQDPNAVGRLHQVVAHSAAPCIRRPRGCRTPYYLHARLLPCHAMRRRRALRSPPLRERERVSE